MSFITLLLYLICTFIRPQDWIPAFYGQQLILILAIATALFLVLERGLKKGAGFVKVPQNMLILGLLFAVLMSHVVHTYLGGMISAWSLFIVNVILFFIIANALNTERKFKFAIWFIVFLISLLAIQGIYQFNHGYGWAGQALTKSDDVGSDRINWVSIFNDPNDLALTFVIAVGILLAFIFGKTKWGNRLAGIALISVLFYGIYLTNSRGGMLALMATVLFYFVKRSKKFLLGAIIGVLLVAAIFAFGPSRMALLSSDEASAYNRIDLWYQGLQMLKSNLIFGVGFNMFQEDLPQTAHNSYVLAGAELGFIGLFFFVGLIYASFKALSLVQKNDEQLKTYAYGLQSSLIGFCSAAFFLSRTYIILPYVLFALSGALFYLVKQKNDKIIFKFSFIDVRNTALLSVGIMMFIYGVVKVGL